ncbi:MAG: hypothetical protein IV090_06930 [Candidatus Sericytochromatia bacterium]|jgi:hypothetical protein|nr:hypothetical protein [Candidatus Sericytochromatia bacterium]
MSQPPDENPAEQEISSGADAVDNLLNALVADQVWRSEEAARAQGQNAEEIAQTLLEESWRMLVLLIRELYDTIWPESESWEPVVSHLLECSEAEAGALSRQLIAAGWLDSSYQPTGAGLWQAGLAREG